MLLALLTSSIQPRATTISLALSPAQLFDLKGRLLESVVNNQPLDDDGFEAVGDLVANAPPVPTDSTWWAGRFWLRSTAELAAALPEFAETESPVVVSVGGEGGTELSIDAGEDLEFFGVLDLEAGGEVGRLRATLDAANGLPKRKPERSMALLPVFVDDNLLLLQEAAAPDAAAAPPRVLVLTRLPPESSSELLPGLELYDGEEDDYIRLVPRRLD